MIEPNLEVGGLSPLRGRAAATSAVYTKLIFQRLLRKAPAPHKAYIHQGSDIDATARCGVLAIRGRTAGSSRSQYVVARDQYPSAANKARTVINTRIKEPIVQNVARTS